MEERWVTAEENDARQAAQACRRRPASEGGDQQRVERRGAGTESVAVRRTPSVHRCDARELDAQYRRQQALATDLERRVQFDKKKREQERMQAQQDLERAERIRMQTMAAAREVEESLKKKDQEEQLRWLQAAALQGPAAAAAAAGCTPLAPTFGPTGQCLDLQQHLLRASRADVGAPAAKQRKPSAPRRRTRWDPPEDEADGRNQSTARERSLRGRWTQE